MERRTCTELDRETPYPTSKKPSLPPQTPHCLQKPLPTSPKGRSQKAKSEKQKTNRTLRYLTMVKRANLRRSCFIPAWSKRTVALQSCPVPSTLITSPRPKRWCSMIEPGVREGEDGLDEVDGDDGLDGLDEVDDLMGLNLPPCASCNRRNSALKGSTGGSGLRGGTALG